MTLSQELHIRYQCFRGSRQREVESHYPIGFPAACLGVPLACSSVCALQPGALASGYCLLNLNF